MKTVGAKNQILPTSYILALLNIRSPATIPLFLEDFFCLGKKEIEGVRKGKKQKKKTKKKVKFHVIELYKPEKQQLLSTTRTRTTT